MSDDTKVFLERLDRLEQAIKVARSCITVEGILCVPCEEFHPGDWTLHGKFRICDFLIEDLRKPIPDDPPECET